MFYQTLNTNIYKKLQCVIYQRLKANNYKQLQNAIYLLRFYKNKICIFLNFQKKFRTRTIRWKKYGIFG